MARIPLTHLSRRLAADYGRTVSHRRLYAMVLDGAFPAEREGRGWSVAEADVPAVATAAGLPLVRASAPNAAAA